MKKLILTCASIVLSLNLWSYKGGETETKAAESSFTSLPQQFSEKLSSPEFEVSGLTSGVIYLEYHINNHLNVVVDRIRSSDLRLQQHFEKDLQNLNFYVSRDMIGKRMNVKIRFQ